MKDKILEIISEECNINIYELDDDSSFIEDLGLDSIQLMELVMILEEEFEIEMDEDDITSIETIGDVIEYINNL